MAKKKDLDDENINEENQGDINEANDSFGLPDVDYKPLDEEEEESETEASAETDAEPLGEEEEQETYAYTADDDASNSEEKETTYVPGSYTPPKPEGNKTGIVIVAIILVVIAIGATWYWGFHLPAERELAEKARIEKERQDKIEADKADAKAEADRIAQEQAAAEAAAQEAAETAEPEPGTIETISARTNRYYVVVASAVDGDLAMDYAKDLSEAGESIKIIEPYGNVKFYRVTLQNLDTWDEAQSAANDMKATYGDGVWVIKY